MTDFKRLASSALLGLGVLLVFFGLNAALGFTPGGAVASLLVIGALLYSGAVWFASAAPPRYTPDFSAPIVFDRDGLLVGEAERGQPLASRFPEALRAEVHQRCAAALAGVPGWIVSEHDGHPATFEFLPVRSSNGTIVYGLLVVHTSITAPMAASA
jgi:hypothetical protein